jgi:hypothetical protein
LFDFVQHKNNLRNGIKIFGGELIRGGKELILARCA